MSPKSNEKTVYTGFEGERSGYYFDVRETLFDQQSEFQRVQIVDTYDYGKILLLENEVMTTDWDGFVYPEMLMHPALMSHAAPQSVAIIGGGDGGAVTETCRHPDVESVQLCEIDELVVTASREFFPKLAAGLNDERARCFYEEGGAWLQKNPASFDVLAVDGTDPIGPGVQLFEEAFYQTSLAALKPGGIFVQQVESPFYCAPPKKTVFDLSFPEIIQRARAVFPRVHVYTATIPLYIGALWSFMIAGDENLSIDPRPERWEKIQGQTRYYTPEIHRAAFALPAFVRELI